MKSIEIKGVHAHASPGELERFYAIMIHAYAVTEAEIWGENYARMPWEEFQQLAGSGGMLGVWVDAIPVGSVTVKQVSETHFSFGLLSVDFDYKGMHLGRKLIEAAEEFAIKKGGSYLMLELLRLENEELPFKLRLKEWYEQMGFVYTETVSFLHVERTKPEKVQHLLKPSVFDCYEKKLR